MESEAARSQGRGRKRRRTDVQNVQNARVGRPPKKRPVETRSKALVGTYLKKEFEGSGTFLGKIVSYDSGLYRVDYEDGDCEDLETGEVRELLIGDDGFDDDLVARKLKLDELVSKKDVNTKQTEDRNLVASVSAMERVEASSSSELNSVGANEVDAVQVVGEADADADSSSDSCEYGVDKDSSKEVEAPLLPPPLLPPSSGNISVPEEYVSHLFSVYSFLRSFSIRLFLSPFSLDDLVGSLNCPVSNTLLDAIHVALMRALRHHLETLSADGSQLPSKCLRSIDWSLLDTLTWPVYLVQYLMLMGYTEKTDWKETYIDVLERDYYSISVGKKLIILQILCDDVLDSAELRAEIDMREEAEGGVDLDAYADIASNSGPRRVHPRFSKTSACKDQVSMEIISENHDIKSNCRSSSIGFKGTEPGVVADIDQDGNGDECRLCGMDGTLLCCDGCPSAYHSRCIGVNKMSIPEGVWYCPECTINKIGPTINSGTTLRGAEVFGVDVYQQVFVGSCNHLLVLKISINSEHCCRYYNQSDIPNVLRALHSSAEHIALYSEICKGILQYWEISESTTSLLRTVQMDTTFVKKNEDDQCSTPLLTLPGEECQKVLDKAEVISANCTTESATGYVETACLQKPPGLMNTSSDMTLIDHSSLRNGDDMRKQLSPLRVVNLSEQVKVDCTISAASVSHQACPSDITHQSLAGKSIPVEFASCTSGNSNGSYRTYVNGICVTPILSSQIKEGNDLFIRRGHVNLTDGCSYMGSFFKPHSYINHYVHGDFAASAAANLAILSSEENRVSESHASNNLRKVVSANVSFQVKAFSSAAIRFFWPNAEKKLVEVPRERCGWCFSCKAPVTSKKGCLLNAAASNAIKGAVRILAGLRPVKIGEGSLSAIASYVMFMEESLRGLIVGPLLHATYRRQWRKRLEQATTLEALKTLLLELEENIRIIALSGDWVKLLDYWATEPSATQSATTSGPGSTQRRGPSGRRGRKPSTLPEVAVDDCHDKRDHIWWRGGMLTKIIFQKGILPRSLVKKAARQGGSRKIPDTQYVEHSEVPRRSRRLVWRAAVEMSKNAAQLALQVRYLDLHVRWSDLIRPDQTMIEGKGPDTEASAFRNAFVCDKKVVEKTIRYGVAFGSQKHLPSKVMKNIIEVEQTQEGKEKYWFSETRIPLYLIKEFEENLEKTLPPSAGKPTNAFSKLQIRQLRASRKDIFSYLCLKRDNLDKCSCASCQQDVLLGNAVKCSACQGFCHEGCTISSTVHLNEEVEFLITCKHCCNKKGLSQNENRKESPTSPLLLRGQPIQIATPVIKLARQKPTKSVADLETPSKIKSASHDASLSTKSRRKLSWGLIWKKKPDQDTGIDFRLKNILLKGNPDMSWSGPVCHLCHQPYNRDLMYIRCQTCEHWFHAEAVELEESRIFDLIGFKCCKCRRIRSPVCPYLDPESKKVLEGKKFRPRTSKQGNSDMDLDRMTSHFKELERTLPVVHIQNEVVPVREDDPILISLAAVEQFTKPSAEDEFERNAATASGPGPQKLPVRRQMKRENEVDSFQGSDPQIELSGVLEPSNPSKPPEGSSPAVEWDVSTNGFEDSLMFDYENIDFDETEYEPQTYETEFEPQTYFSFTELLETDDAGQLDGVDTSGDAVRNWETSTAILENGNTEQFGLGTAGDHQEPTFPVGTAGNGMPCWKCCHTEPCPDLSCEICGLWIHTHCSPWVEQSPLEGTWRCGNCREWR